MKWFNEHLNWTYSIILVISILILIPMVISSGIDENSIGTGAFIGLGVFFVLNIAGGGWALWKKGQSLWYLALALVFYIGFLLLVFLLPDKRTGRSESGKISEADYYKDRQS